MKCRPAAGAAAVLLCLLILVAGRVALSNGSQDCCTSIPRRARDCIDACQKVWMSNGPLQRLENMAFVYMACPATRNWEQTSACLNSTYQVIRDVELWEGRACCELASTIECKLACMQAAGSETLHGVCHKTQERRLHSCLARQEGSRQCCRPLTSMPSCRMACRALFAREGSPTSELRDMMSKLCGITVGTAQRDESGGSLSQCIANHSHSMVAPGSANDLLCCQRSAKPQCAAACSNALQTLTDGQAMVNAMMPDCGAPQPLDPMWRCFLLGSQIQHGGTESDTRGTPQGGARHGGSSNGDNGGRGGGAGAGAGGLAGGGGGSVVVPLADPPVDGARLLCCSHARTLNCRQLCWQLYAGAGISSSSSNAGDSRVSVAALWGEFSSQCQHDPRETVLAHCLQEVEEPCSPGCNGLKFCEAFNDRPTDMFRACTAHADQAAQRYFESWVRSKVISFPNGFKIALKDPTTCEPDLWKAVACALQIKPCRQRSHSSRICKSDCLYILNKCADFAQMPDQNDYSLCEHLSVSDNEECVSLKQFASGDQRAPSTAAHVQGVTHPCRPNPCNSSHVCEVNRKPCARNENCRPYVCLPACLVAHTASSSAASGSELVSSLAVKHGYHVLIPDASSARLSWVCHQLCTCRQPGIAIGSIGGGSSSSSGTGLIGHCTKLDCTSSNPEDCYAGGFGSSDDEMSEHFSESHRIEHGKKVTLGCTECTCLAGKLTCSRTGCMSTVVSTGLPCGCPRDYSPVCAKNGKTYANRCLAQCSRLSDEMYISGSCASRNPCRSNPCAAGHKCIPRKHVCLNSDVECRQYVCISSLGTCNINSNEPVCDSKGFDIRNLCVLLQSEKHLAYRGHCMSLCEQTGVVCGVNGETYSSECAAWAERVLADYEGPCKAIGSRLEMQVDAASDNWRSPACLDVKCPGNIPVSCQAIIPPGACCPVCGAELRMSYNRRLLKTLSSAGHSAAAGSQVVTSGQQSTTFSGLSAAAIPVSDIADHLRQYVTVAECDVFSFLSIEDEIVILIVPVVRNPSSLQVNACNGEAEKVSTWINARNPMVVIDAKLSILVSSRIRLASLEQPQPQKGPSCCASPAIRVRHSLATVVAALSLIAVTGCS